MCALTDHARRLVIGRVALVGHSHTLRRAQAARSHLQKRVVSVLLRHRRPGIKVSRSPASVSASHALHTVIRADPKVNGAVAAYRRIP